MNESIVYSITWVYLGKTITECYSDELKANNRYELLTAVSHQVSLDKITTSEYFNANTNEVDVERKKINLKKKVYWGF